jgi:hypothetical protein
MPRKNKESRKEYRKEYQKSEKGKAIRKKYLQSEKFKTYIKKYQKSEKYKEAVSRSSQKIKSFRANRRELYLKDNNIKVLFPHLVKEWHPTKNGDLKPEELTRGSNKIIWWLCSKRHEWESIVPSRTIMGTNCPECGNRKVGKDNNLKYLHPNIAKEWHPTKNGDLKPENVVPGSNKNCWWLCSKGHEYQTTCRQRVFVNTKCSKCSNQTSKPEFRIIAELESIFKKVSSRHKFKKTEIDVFIEDINLGIEYDGAFYHLNKHALDIQKNIFLKKNSIKLIRVRKVPLNKLSDDDILVDKDELKKTDLDNIFCSILKFCNNEQKILIYKYLEQNSFVNEDSYRKYLSYFPGPIPSKSLATVNPELAKQWDYEKNYPLVPESFYPKSGESVWWICEKGHSWKSTIHFRGKTFKPNERNCHRCGYYTSGYIKTNNLILFHPDIAKEWHPTKNGDLKPDEVTRSSSKKVWWLCPSGHEYACRIYSRTHKVRPNGCLKCHLKKRFPQKHH